MVFGGVEKELTTILKRLKENYDISILLFYSQDDRMLSSIPNEVKIINLNIDKLYYCSSLPTLVKQRIKRGDF